MASIDVTTLKVESDNLTTSSQSTGTKSTVITVVASEPPESQSPSHLNSPSNNDNAQVIYIEHTGSFPSTLPTETYQQILSFSKTAGEGVNIDAVDDIPVLREVNVCTTDKHTKGQDVSNGNNLFKCENCDYSSNNKNYLKQHVDLVHNAGRPYKCPYCDYAGKRNHSLREHLVVHSNERPFECTHCNATFRKKGHLTNHIKLHAMSKVIKCSLCSEILTDQTKYTEHLKSVHKTDHLYACEMCQYVAGDENSIKLHMEQHSVHLYQCSMCSFVTKALNLMESHIETHNSKVINAPKSVSSVTEIKPNKAILDEQIAGSSQTSVLIKCSECGFIAKDRSSMNSHMMKHLETEKIDKPKVIQTILPQKTSYKCTECSYTSNEAPSFIHHMLIHKTEAKKNNEAVAVNVSKIKPISKENTCTTSNAPFIHDERTGRFICTICGYACEYQRTIKSHIWKHSGNKDIEYPMFQNGPLSVYEENVSKNQSDLPLIDRVVKKDLAKHSSNGEMVIDHPAQIISTPTTSKPPQKTQLMLNSTGDICQIKISDGNILTLMKGSETQSLKLHEFSKMENKKPVYVSSVLNTNPKQVAVVVEAVQAVPTSHAYTGISSQQNSPKRAATPNDEPVPKKQKISKLDSSMASSSVVKSGHNSENEVKVEKIETGGRSKDKDVEEGSSEPVEALLSLQKDETLTNSPPSDRNEPQVYEKNKKESNEGSVKVEMVKEEVVSEAKVSDASKVSTAAGGICSSLLAVIEQLRERSKSDIDLENYTKAGVRRSGRKRIRRASSDDEMPSEFSDNIEKIIEDGETRYRCKFCHYSNSKPLLIRIHMRLHKSKKPFECSLCDFIALSIEGLQDHMIQHCKVRTYQCKLCPSAFNYKSQLRAHMRAHNEKDPFICDFCEFVTSNITAYHQHVQRHSNSSYTCNVCQKKYSSKTSLMRHECTKISNDSLGELEASSDEETLIDLVSEIKCPHCEFTCVNMADYKLHAVVHADEEEAVALKCELCDFTAVSNRSLKSHMKRHINDQRYVQQPLEQYKCNLCGYVCHHLPSLKSHMWRHASDRNYSYEFTNDVINAAIDYDIRVDGRDVNDPEILERVLNSERKIVEGRLNNTQQPGGKIPVCWVTFRCCQCGFETINKPELNVHMRSHADIIEQTLEVNNKVKIESENSQLPIILSN